MRYPQFLKENGSIGFVAPSFGCATEPYISAFKNAQKKLSQKGHMLILGSNCYESRGVGISNIPQLCGKELNDMYCDSDADILISCGGGELMCEILEYVDFKRIAQSEPKWYMGYSDNTNFTFLNTILCDTATIYGPCAAAFGMEPWYENIKDCYELLRGRKLYQTGYDKWESDSLKSEDNPLAPINATQPRVLRTYDENGKMTDRHLEFSGRLIGGCMDCLVNITGTKYDKTAEFIEKYKADGIIWFLESCDLNVFSIRRAMWQMDNAGWFKYTKGFIIGRPMVHGQEMMGLDQYEAVMAVIRKYKVPVIMDADIGHIPPSMPVICGSYAEVNIKGRDFKINMILK